MNNVLASRVAILALVALSSLTVAGCFGNSNPVIGKWTVDPQSTGGCPDSLEFTATTMSVSAAGIAASHDVTYAVNGADVVVSSPDGFSATAAVNGNNLTFQQQEQCSYVRGQ
jgi:hypothetical protein